jgi:hypothetical protein
MRQRIDDLNAIYDEIHATYGGVQVDFSEHPGIYDREFWSLDRLHPSELGHWALAHEFSALLEQHGLTFDPPALELDGDPTTRFAELRTLAIDGVPWLARRVRDLGPSLGRRALQYLLGCPFLAHQPTQRSRDTPGPARI